VRASGLAFDALRIAGVAYLLFMAVVTWRDKSRLTVQDEQPLRSPVRAIGSAMLANVLNPKLTRVLLRVSAAVRATTRSERAGATA